jgi:hypothetical protein
MPRHHISLNGVSDASLEAAQCELPLHLVNAHTGNRAISE